MSNSSPDYEHKPSGYYATARSDVVDLIPADVSKVLDIGCAEGLFGAALKESRPDIETWGIEPMPEAARVAQTRLTRVIVSSVEAALASLPDGYFDCITFNDVLEHLNDPWQILRAVRPKLSKHGCVLASIPNVRHYDVIKQLIWDADFRYVDQGVLDNTHLRFFTKKSMHRMLAETGYQVTQVRGLRWTRFPMIVSIINRLTRRALDDMHYMQFAVLARAVDA